MVKQNSKTLITALFAALSCTKTPTMPEASKTRIPNSYISCTDSAFLVLLQPPSTQPGHGKVLAGVACHAAWDSQRLIDNQVKSRFYGQHDLIDPILGSKKTWESKLHQRKMHSTEAAEGTCGLAKSVSNLSRASRGSCSSLYPIRKGICKACPPILQGMSTRTLLGGGHRK